LNSTLSLIVNRLRALRRPIYPFLLAVYPIFLLYRWNSEQLSLSVLKVPCVIALAIAGAVFFVLYLILRNANKAALVTACLFLQSTLTGHFFEMRSTASSMPIGWTVAYALLTFGSIWFTWESLRRRDSHEFLKEFNVWANVVLACLILIIPLNVIVDNLGDRLSWELQPNARVLTDLEMAKRRPDIFYIILDGYARQDVLTAYFKYNNAPFIDFLRRRGFYVASGSRCNYSVTFLSLSSSLNMQYLDALNGVHDQEEQAIRMIGHNRIMENLKSNGYRIVHFSTAWPGDDVNLLADQTFSSSRLDEFRELLLKTSFLRFFYSATIGNSYRERFYFNCEKLGSLLRQRRPTFVYAHFVMPHPPYVFDREGALPVPRTYLHRPAGSRDWYPPCRYVDQLSYMTRHIQATITKILDNYPVPPIIILQSDHGPGCDGITAHPTNKMLLERTGILNAFYVPDVIRHQLYSTISPVNTFRILLNTYFGGNWRLEKDETNYVWGVPPYRFMNVTQGPNKTADTISSGSANANEVSSPYMPTSDWAGD
jgi:hypothetical protein